MRPRTAIASQSNRDRLMTKNERENKRYDDRRLFLNERKEKDKTKNESGSKQMCATQYMYIFCHRSSSDRDKMMHLFC